MTPICKTPCRECPWRRASLAGWVGGNTPEEWAELAQSELRIWCHLRGYLECRGAAIFRRNIAKLPRDASVLLLEADRVAVFANPAEFIAHHRAHGMTSADLFAPMNTKQVVEKVRDVIAEHDGDERELLEALDAEAEGWRMRLQELESEGGG